MVSDAYGASVCVATSVGRKKKEKENSRIFSALFNKNFVLNAYFASFLRVDFFQIKINFLIVVLRNAIRIILYVNVVIRLQCN